MSVIPVVIPSVIPSAIPGADPWAGRISLNSVDMRRTKRAVLVDGVEIGYVLPVLGRVAGAGGPGEAWEAQDRDGRPHGLYLSDWDAARALCRAVNQ